VQFDDVQWLEVSHLIRYVFESELPSVALAIRGQGWSSID
jgi:hypothetical protein